jgi:hypothetical protein
MWPIVRRFGLVALGVVALWLATVLVVNLTLFSAAGHVSSYLRALESENFGLAASRAGLSETPRVTPLNGSGIENPKVVGAAALANGDVAVRAEYEILGATQSTVFVVEPGEPVLFFFTQWRFAKAPTSSLEFSVIGDNRVTVNASDLVLTTLGVPPRVKVLVPGHYEASLETEWLESEVASATVSEVGSTTPIRLRLQPTSQLRDTAASAVEEFLNDCVNQKVLQPVGCPFGVSIDDRVLGSPEWKILDYPEVALALSGDRASWSMVATGGVAEVTIQVQSLFDGTVEQRVDEVSFDLNGLVRGTGVDQPVLNLF